MRAWISFKYKDGLGKTIGHTTFIKDTAAIANKLNKLIANN
jgi:hypothetical protein